MADIPLLDLAISHIAWNHLTRPTFKPCLAVPVVIESCVEHLARCQMRFLLATGLIFSFPHFGQILPSGHLTSMTLR